MTEELGNCWCGQPAVFLDTVTSKEYCFSCSLTPDRSSDDVYLQLLQSLLPFEVGDEVECYQAGDRQRYIGRGTIEEISTDLDEGGTPVFPVYRVKFKKGEGRWFTSVCFTRVSSPVYKY